MWNRAASWEYGFLDDFHFSVWEELNGERKFQIDNYYAMDVYRIWGTFDFHSAFLITNDLNLLDAEAIQLTLGYMSLNRVLESLSVRAGRQFFSEGFDTFVGDGLIVEYHWSRLLQLSLHFAQPFDAESEAIDNEPVRIYGIGVETSRRGGDPLAPFRLSAHVERRDRKDSDGLDQTLLGLELVAELTGPVESDIYADLEYEVEDTRMRRAKFGSHFYLSPMLSCRLEVERYDPEKRNLSDQFREFLQDAITNYMSGSEVWSGTAALNYALPRGRVVSIAYAGQSYDRRNGDRTFGHGGDCFVTFLRIPSMDASAGAGYSGRIVEEDSIHLGILRASAFLAPRLQLKFLSESGILTNRKWDGEFVLHARGSLLYTLWANLQISLHVEENKNPYFESDFRGMTFVRYFWGRRAKK